MGNKTDIDNISEEQSRAMFGFGKFISFAAAVQTVCILLLLAGIIIIKSFFPELFGDIKRFYDKSFTVETSVSEVLGDEK